MEKVKRTAVCGPLAPYADGFRAELAGLGYAAWSIEDYLRMMAQLSRWLSREGVETGGLDSARAAEFIESRRASGQRRRLPTRRTLGRLLDYLHRQGLVAAPVATGPGTPVELLVASYRGYLVGRRGLAAPTVRRNVDTARRFLGQRAAAAGGGTGVDGLTAAEVSTFLLRECSRLGRGTVRNRVQELRSLLRFLRLEGLAADGLAEAVPSVAGWAYSRLPAVLSSGDVEALLGSCDVSRPVGCRDFAVLTLLARLGLRAGEVCRLGLDDVDWRAGEILIRGKGGRRDRLPLPTDVGQALVGYLAGARPPTACRRLFVTCVAPRRGLQPSTVSKLVRVACGRAGLPPVHAHRLRHALASRMLAHGAPLAEISQVLRHRACGSTMIYTKVDRVALRTVVQPWPGTV